MKQENVDINSREIYMKAEIHAMDKAIYIESEKVNRNLRIDMQGANSNTFFIEWINKHASAFNEAWNRSLCKDCKQVEQCYNCLKEKCECFERSEQQSQQQSVNTAKENATIMSELRKIITN